MCDTGSRTIFVSLYSAIASVCETPVLAMLLDSVDEMSKYKL